MRTHATRTARFGVCTDNSGYPASLEVGKLYPVIPDPVAARHGYIRVIDESGEDYGYSAERFFVLRVPPALARSLGGRFGRVARKANGVPRPAVASRRRRRATA